MFLDSLQVWQNFYFMLGGAVATLIGLIFVAVSLGVNLVSDDTRDNIALYVTPILSYFISVLVVALIMLTPWPAPTGWAGLLVLIGGWGISRVLGIAWRMLQPEQRAHAKYSHWLWHVIVPGLSFALIGVMALWFVAAGAGLALFGLAVATVLLLISSTWRVWDLILWIAHQRIS